MEQKAVVKRILPDGRVEVSLMRQLECGLSCKSCEGCPQKPKDELLATADNALGAGLNDVVTVRPNAGGALGGYVLVFLLPCLFLILGYLLGAAAGFGEGACLLAAFAGLVLGFVPAVLFNRWMSGRKGPEFTILHVER